MLVEYFTGKRWHTEFLYSLIPDNEEELIAELNECINNNVDFVFTTGGTGIGPAGYYSRCSSEIC